MKFTESRQFTLPLDSVVQRFRVGNDHCTLTPQDVKRGSVRLKIPEFRDDHRLIL